jgi:hypothetical protein
LPKKDKILFLSKAYLSFLFGGKLLIEDLIHLIPFVKLTVPEEELGAAHL